MNHIILIGMRGAGKSYIGKKISKETDLPFFDTDTEIEKQEKKSIVDIIKECGWDYFRKKENQMLKKTLKLERSVIATGGGAPLRKDNFKILKEMGYIIWIYADIEDLIKRLKKDNNRPSLRGEKFEIETREIYKEREPIYKKASDYKMISHTSEKDLKDELKMFFKKNPCIVARV